ncbi:DinB family protein [Flagellimonas flava]|uniref:DinB superfamily protein n=1 Tax=Flagellimonas flava TaxID=570519 RepID=A0A1M5IP12_9FLAO|nr:DinB family protein [Allomuricauda flava]SHG29976.1 DinB superfamily protein [Allomuricauda flava]
MSNYNPHDGFPYYFEQVQNQDLKTLYNPKEIVEFLDGIEEEKANYRYAPGKWSIKQVVGHITDHERIKMSRAFFLSRNQQMELWGYDQNALVNNSRFDQLQFSTLVSDFKNVRSSSVSFIATLSENQLNLIGRARQYDVTLKDFLKSIIGHEVHHLNILKERYF